MAKEIYRCEWARTDSERDYHDHEWGVPVRDEHRMFEFLILEGAQAGLSWSTILNKRDNYRKAFAQFEPEKVARFTEAKQQKLLLNPGIVRNRLKVSSAVTNAKIWVAMKRAGEDPLDHLWSFVGGKPRQNSFHALSDIPAKTEQAEAMSRDLRKRGFKFVGPTICYALMQAAGLVNDHETRCFRYKAVKKLR